MTGGPVSRETLRAKAEQQLSAPYAQHNHGVEQELARGVLSLLDEREHLIADCGERRMSGGPVSRETLRAKEIARAFHEAYERLAPEFGYETRVESAVPWEQVPLKNRSLMEAVVTEVVGPIVDALAEAEQRGEWMDKELALAEDRAKAYLARAEAAEQALASSEQERAALAAVVERQREALAEAIRFLEDVAPPNDTTRNRISAALMCLREAVDVRGGR